VVLNDAEEHKIIEAMAKAACRAAGNSNPNAPGERVVGGITKRFNPAWRLWWADACDHFHMRREMEKRLAEIETGKSKKERFARMQRSLAQLEEQMKDFRERGASSVGSPFSIYPRSPSLRA
jgi:DNA topoisomerase IA